MATTTTLSLHDILSNFISSAESAIHVLPEATQILAPPNGISLLDAKNEIFLSYLQALALRNLNVIGWLKDGRGAADVQELSDRITTKLLEHRVYLERGVRALEGKIRYQVDKAVKAAEDEERAKTQAGSGRRSRAVNGASQVGADGKGSSDESDSDSEVEIEIEATSYRPNLSAFADPSYATSTQAGPSKSLRQSDAVYRPPRISATSMPTSTSREPKAQRPARSSTIDEYVRTEMSNAPLAEPSIGSTITGGGRTTKDARQLAREQERKEYEETHLMRLAPESKKERAKLKAKERKGAFGGEEWQGLGESVDRIGDLTRRKKESALERSRKRGRDVQDGPRNDGSGIGSAFDAKKRRVMKKMKR